MTELGGVTISERAKRLIETLEKPWHRSEGYFEGWEALARLYWPVVFARG